MRATKRVVVDCLQIFAYGGMNSTKKSRGLLEKQIKLPTASEASCVPCFSSRPSRG